jgi:hypothetical protein
VIDASAARMLLLTVRSWRDSRERERPLYQIEENRVLRRRLRLTCPFLALWTQQTVAKAGKPRHKAKAEISPLSLLGLHGPATASNEPQRAATASCYAC